MCCEAEGTGLKRKVGGRQGGREGGREGGRVKECVRLLGQDIRGRVVGMKGARESDGAKKMGAHRTSMAFHTAQHQLPEADVGHYDAQQTNQLGPQSTMKSPTSASGPNIFVLDQVFGIMMPGICSQCPMSCAGASLLTPATPARCPAGHDK